MNRIDRYIVLLFLRVFCICYVCMTGLMIVVDLFTNLDDLIDAGRRVGGLSQVLIGYYGPFAISCFTRLCPFFALLALLFVVSWLKRTSELIALLAAGISKRRVLKFPIAAAVGLVVLSTLLRETVIPAYQDVLGKRPQDLSGENHRVLRPTLDPQTGVLIGGQHIELLNSHIIRPMFRLTGRAAAVGQQISAERAVYEPADAVHPAGYRLTGIRYPLDLTSRPSVRLEDQPWLFSPADTPWLKSDQVFVASSVEFFLLQGGSNWSQYDSTLNIVRRLHAQPTFYGPDVRVKVHSRLLQPLLDVSMILFGLPVVLRRIDRNLFSVAAATTSKVLLFTAVVIGIQALASNSVLVSPFLAAWLPILLVGPYAWADSRVSTLS